MRAMPGRLIEACEDRPNKGNMIKLGAKRTAHEAHADEPTINGANTAEETSPNKRIKFSDLPALQDNASSTQTTQSDLGKSQEQPQPSTSMSQLPPELEHITFGYQPLGTLLARVSQECLNGMNDLLADLPQNPGSRIPNGIPTPSDSALTSLGGAKKRKALMDFAHVQRERFIKLSVLLQWSKRAEQVGKLIDISATVRDQEAQYENAGMFLGQLKRDTFPAKFPNPDIQTAHETLATGTSARYPDFHYVPPPPLTAESLLRDEQNINMLIHVRLNLNNDLPPAFKSYRVHSGRVTFVVLEEFEVDLSIGDEDPTSQFFFVDLRLLFSNPEIPLGQLRAQLEGFVNHTLATTGLTGCYQVLHEIALSHKLNLLRRQAVELNRTYYANTLRVEFVHRVLTVQYWRERPGKKSWFEVAVRNGSDSPGQSNKSSHLEMKWVRNGQEIKSHHLGDHIATTLDLELILKRIIACHISFILGRTHDKLTSTTSMGQISRSFGIVESLCEPCDCLLEMPCRSAGTASVIMDPVNGNIILSPKTSSSVACTRTLNALHDPAEEACATLQKWLAVEVRADVDLHASAAGYNIAKPPEYLRIAVRKNTHPTPLELSFLTKSSWKQSGWHIVCAIGVSRETWWVAKIGPDRPGSRDKILVLESLPILNRNEHVQGQSAAFFADLDRLSVTMISCISLCSALRKLKVGCQLSKSQPESFSDLPVLSLDIRSLVTAYDASTKLPSSKESLFSSGLVSLSIFGGQARAENDLEVVYLVRGMFNKRVLKQELLSLSQSQDLRIDPSGAFALLLRAPLDSATILEQIVSRVLRLQRLNDLVSVLHHHELKPKTLTPSQVSFEYAASPAPLQAVIAFVQPDRVALSLAPRTANPHVRIYKLLERLLNSGMANGTTSFHRFVRALFLTLPLLQSFDALENKDVWCNRVRILVDDADMYSIHYPKVRCTFRVRFDSSQEAWEIKQMMQTSPTGPSAESTKLAEILRSYFSQSDTGWNGDRSAIVADAASVDAAVKQLDVIMSKFEEEAASMQADAMQVDDEKHSEPESKQPHKAISQSKQPTNSIRAPAKPPPPPMANGRSAPAHPHLPQPKTNVGLGSSNQARPAQPFGGAPKPAASAMILAQAQAQMQQLRNSQQSQHTQHSQQSQRPPHLQPQGGGTRPQNGPRDSKTDVVVID